MELTEYLGQPFLGMKGEFNRTKASDMYRIGALLWEISSGKTLYNPLFTNITDYTIVGTPPLNYIRIYQGSFFFFKKKMRIVSERIFYKCK